MKLQLTLIAAATALSPHIRLHGKFIDVRMQQDPPPPELDERQAQFMEARGFKWNPKSRSWA